MKNAFTITIEPSNRSLNALVATLPQFAEKPHRNKKAYNRKREKRCFSD